MKSTKALEVLRINVWIKVVLELMVSLVVMKYQNKDQYSVLFFNYRPVDTCSYLDCFQLSVAFSDSVS